MTEPDPGQVRSSVIAYRNLPGVDSNDECYYLMRNVSYGLTDIIRYLNHTIWSLENTFAVLMLTKDNHPIDGHIVDDYPNASWFRIDKTISDERNTWKRSFRDGGQVLSSLEVENVSPYTERIPRGLSSEILENLMIDIDGSQFLAYPIEILDYNETRNLVLLSTCPLSMLKRRQRTFWILYIPSTYQWKKYREALQNLVNEPQRNLHPLLKLFQKTQYTSWPSVTELYIAENEWLFLVDQDNPSTEIQRTFVRRALDTPDFALLWGPPGSGKTFAIMELIYQAARRGMRVLFCASTHVAIDQALERLLANTHAREYVAPLRIGKSDKISTLIRDFQLENIAPKYRKLLIDELSGLQVRTESQSYWLSTLNSDQWKEWISRLLVDSANLVCGTTVGILKHPEIRAGKTHDTKPVYDILIIDEASKTTFHEFLVPAQFAKRWVLCGDPRQLSPFVDDESIAATVRTLLDDEAERRCCADVYSVAKQYPVGGQKRKPIQLLLISSDETESRLYRTQAEGKNLPVVEIDEESDLEDTKELARILSSPVILCVDAKAPILARNLPGTVEIIRGKREMLGPAYSAKRAHFENTRRLWKDQHTEWEHELAVILGQEFITRTTQDGTFEKYGVKKRLLLPEFLVRGESEEDGDLRANSVEVFSRRLERIRLCAYPSVLELLVEGFRPEPEFDSTLNGGFPEEYLKERLSMLHYQFRMHPEISLFPRTHIYDSTALKDAPNLENIRRWPFRRYARHALWVDVKGQCEDDSNEREGLILVRQLADFVAWAGTNPPKGGNEWEVAVLSFYNNQVDLLHRQIQRNLKLIYDGSGFYTGKNVQVRVGSVDSIQGREADIVFISFVRNRSTGVGFLNSPNRLNVALTRARIQLVLIGDKGYFADQDESELLQSLAELPDDTPFGGVDK